MQHLNSDAYEVAARLEALKTDPLYTKHYTLIRHLVSLPVRRFDHVPHGDPLGDPRSGT